MLRQHRHRGQLLQPPGRQGRDSEQPEVTRGRSLTDGPEHMVDTLLGTSRLAGREEPCRQSLFHLKHLCWAPTISQALSEVLGLQERMEISIESAIALPSRASRIRNAVLIANIRLDTQSSKKKCMLSEKKLERQILFVVTYT